MAMELLVSSATAQIRADWRRVGSTTVDLDLASAATGPVDRAWFSEDGATLFVRTGLKRIYSTSDFERWQWVPDAVIPESPAAAAKILPERMAKSRASATVPTRFYAVGRNGYRSDDGGFTWTNLTAFQNRSIIGEGLADVAVSPTDPDQVVIAGAQGVWRSLDGGLSWTGLNQSLPNLPVRRILALPDGNGPLRISADGISTNSRDTELEWAIGEKSGWKPVLDDPASTQAALTREALGGVFGNAVTAIASSGDFFYAATADGKLRSSSDRGATWQSFDLPGGGVAENIFLDPKDPQFALAAVSGNAKVRVERTLNAGRLWDDISDNLPAGSAHGISADRQSGALYVAADRGVFMTYTDTRALAPATPWTLVKAGADDAPAMDVRLDSAGNQLYAAFQGDGLFAAIAPHRARDPRVVSAGDMVERAASPGSLLSVVGRQIQSAQAGNRPAPVFEQSQIQVPFEVTGSTLNLSMESDAGRINVGLPLKSVSPSIFVDREGGPIVLNADTGLLLDAATPARSNSRLQIFTTGLGKVTPDWPTGIPAPLENSPRVAAVTKVYLDREAVEVTRAILAPGYVGFYLIEVQLPGILNRGPAELYVEVNGQQSNRVRIYLEP
ncbi:MAG: hypothetical protein ABJF23_13770 [Bryobacteraceae bacterium]